MARIMVVGSDADLRGNLVSALAEEHAVRAVATARQAIQALQTHAVDIVLLDTPTNDGDWPTVLCQMAAMDSRPLVIILSAHDDVLTATKAIRLGANNYLLKPCSLDTVRSAVRSALEECSLAESLAVG